MPWLALLSAADQPPAPLDAVVSQILGYGVLGVVALAFAFRFIVPASTVTRAREESRADLLKDVDRLERQIERLEQDKRAVELQRDEAVRFTQNQMVPLLAQFTAATSALIPLLQRLVGYQEGGGGIDLRRRQ